jgi:hypothetical protein
MKLRLIIAVLAAPHYSYGFSTSKGRSHVAFTRTLGSSLAAYPPRKNRGNKNQNDEDDDFDPILDEPKGKRGDGRNWIEKSSPIGIGKLQEDDATETDGNYDLGIDGTSFETGPLSTRMYDALTSVALKRFPPGTTSLPSELDDVYKLYTMDITAKEAVRVALDQNGMELALMNEDDPQSQDEGMWGDVDSVKLINMDTGAAESEIYECLDDAVEKGDWTPGQSFNFVVRNVPARLKEMDVTELLSSLDPEGKYREQAKEKGITMPDEDIASLKDLGKDCDRRVNVSPTETESKESVFQGNDSKGYNIIKKSDLLSESRNVDGTENNDVLMHVMDSLVSHGCLIVDLSDGGVSSLDAHTMTKMWEVVGSFFETIEGDDDLMQSLPGMEVVEETGSSNAVAGFMASDDSAMQFLESRIVRNAEGANNDIVPAQVSKIIGNEGATALIDSFDTMCNVGKDVVRVAIAAANMEHDGFLEAGEASLQEEESSDLPFISGLTFEEEEVSGVGLFTDEDVYAAAEKMSSEAALSLVADIIDDGKHKATNDDEGSISLSPHRLCKYTSEGKTETGKMAGKHKETFGAHTDTSFVTIVPVASTSGLEIFDEGANRWFRPELLARRKWELERKARGLDESAQTETISKNGEDIEIPWHSRYICVMPGEVLQVCTRNEVPAAVHRVVCESEEGARISAPVLLRARSGMKMDVEKYFGSKDNLGQLLGQCDGLKMQQIHDALQPSSYRD